MLIVVNLVQFFLSKAIIAWRFFTSKSILDPKSIFECQTQDVNMYLKSLNLYFNVVLDNWSLNQTCTYSLFVLDFGRIEFVEIQFQYCWTWLWCMLKLNLIISFTLEGVLWCVKGVFGLRKKFVFVLLFCFYCFLHKILKPWHKSGDKVWKFIGFTCILWVLSQIRLVSWLGFT